MSNQRDDSILPIRAWTPLPPSSLFPARLWSHGFDPPGGKLSNGRGRVESLVVILAIALLIGGTVVLTVGAEAAIRGAGRFAAAHAVSPFVLGALLFGLDVESLGAALIAAGKGQTSIAAGEAFGTIVFLFSAAFGAALLLSRGPIESPAPNMVLLPAAALAIGTVALSGPVLP